jgi:hypothetical protein
MPVTKNPELLSRRAARASAARVWSAARARRCRAVSAAVTGMIVSGGKESAAAASIGGDADFLKS